MDDGSEPNTPDTGLVRLIVRANAIRDRLLADKSLTFEDIAKSEGVVPSYATRLFRLTVLAPDIVNAILTGKHPPELTARRLMDDTRLPLDWSEQRRRLGFEINSLTAVHASYPATFRTGRPRRYFHFMRPSPVFGHRSRRPRASHYR